MGSTNYDWAALVISRVVPAVPVTANNQDNFTRWMRAENPDTDWWHLDNPLNCGLDDGSADGEGSYPDLDIAATYTAQVLSQSNMAPIADALRANADLATFSAGCAASAWSTGGYHGVPGYIAAIPQEPVIASPETFPSVGPSPPPPPPKEEYEIMDSVLAENGDIVSHAVTPEGHYIEITRKAGNQGLPATDGLSIIDITAQYPEFTVEP